MPLANPLNYCRGCDQDFGSVELFDRHRVGQHGYLYDEGLRMTPPKKDGRRCLSVETMLEKGWQLDARERWTDPERSSRAASMRTSPREAGLSPTSPS